MNSSETSQKYTSFTRGLVAGMLTGGILAFFLAPRSGAETRKKIRLQRDTLRQQAGDVVLKTKTTVEEAVGQGA
jgi:gas vesicle protein